MDRLYPYTQRLVKRARLQRRAAAIALLGVAACTAAFALAGRTGTPAGDPPGSVPAPLAFAAAPAAPARAIPVPRRVYPYSIVPGGVAGPSELAQVIRTDKVVAAHYASFDLGKARAVTVATPRAVHVSYRKGDQVYWTSKKVMLAAGETLLSDGKQAMRARCANRISDVAMFPVEAQEPTADVLDSVVEEQAVDDEAGGYGLLLAGADALAQHAGQLGQSGQSGRLAQAASGSSGSGSTLAAPGIANMTRTQSGSSASQGVISRPAATAPLQSGATPPAPVATPATPALTAPASGNTGGDAATTPVAPASPATPADSTVQAPADGGSTAQPPGGSQAPGSGSPGSGNTTGNTGGNTSGRDGNPSQPARPGATAPGDTSTPGGGESPGPFIPDPGLAPPLPPAGSGTGQPEATPVPEPASGWLAAAALVAMALLARVRRTAPAKPPLRA